jgi:UDP-glucose 4-epimerase
MSETVVVTGGAGFVGATFVRRLLGQGYTVRVVDDLSNGRREYLDGLEVELIVEDIRDLDRLTQALSDAHALAHLAAAGSVVDSVVDPTQNFSSNVLGTFTALEAARRAGIERVVFSSTGGALIGNATPPVNEDSLPKPISPYGASKLAGEAYCHAFAKSFGMRTVATRFANVYGPYSGHKKGAVTAFLKAIHNDQPITIFGDGKASRDFMYVDDVCTGLELAIAADVAGGSVFHLATGVETTIAELADACRRVSGKPEHPIELKPARAGEVERNFASFDHAREVLGFKPNVELDDGLGKTLEWYRAHVF